MAERSRYQQQVIRNYYDNQETIQLQRLGELITDLYLAEGKKADKLWVNALGALEKLKVPPARIAHIDQKRDVKLLATLLEELLAKKPS